MDAINGGYDQAVIISNDADFAGAMRCVRDELSHKVTLIDPDLKNKYIPQELRDAATYIKRIRKHHLAESQFSDRLSDRNGEIIKPSEW